MRATRWITAIAVLVGLGAMHGIGASAAAAAPCGATVAHVHAEVPALPAGPLADDAPGIASPAVDPDGKAGVLCLVILLVWVALGVTARWQRRVSTRRSAEQVAAQPPEQGRGPPLLLIFCVSRT